MIQLLSAKYTKPIAYILLLIFSYTLVPAYGGPIYVNSYTRSGASTNKALTSVTYSNNLPQPDEKAKAFSVKQQPESTKAVALIDDVKEVKIGGPGQPEMASFKSAGADNMVNLFTGDFSYNIPLMDVGGYPINIFYDGGVTMEQEASWVGLGWNINPGTISRNMRGVPDDFNGTDTLLQTQKMKPNTTWGVRLGADLELAGIKNNLPEGLSLSAGVSLGVSVNNYLGPALDYGIKGGAGIKIAQRVQGEKGADSGVLKVGVGLGANVNSRYGLTLTPNVSLTAAHFNANRSISGGLSLATSYNSRSGINALQISGQASFNRQEAKEVKDGEKTKVLEYSQSMSAAIGSSTISFTKPSYLPALRMPITNEAYAGHFQLGGAIFGVYGSAEVEIYKQTSEVANGDVLQKKPLIGYLHYQKANSNPNAVMDFTRLNDKEVTPNTPIISAPQYTYDVFSIQGEGTGGSIRAYRNDQGYVRDNTTRSQDKSLSIGADVGIPGHFGANFNTIKTPSVIGEWGSGNQLRLQPATSFREGSGAWENVYFRNPGETSVLNNDQYKKIGGTDLVRFKLGGTKAMPAIEPVLEQVSKTNTITGTVNMLTAPDPVERKKRTQVTSFLTAEEASKVGLDTFIKNYNATVLLDAANNLQTDLIARVSEYRKPHHLSQINVTEASGKRYIYGIPVYNIVQKDFSFSVSQTETGVDQVAFDATEASANSGLLAKNSSRDGFVQITETPAYAHSFLLTGLLSPDYVDVTGNGITEDDLGDAVKFNYTRVKQGAQWADHLWRTPLSGTTTANFNAGNRTEVKDDKGLVSYGKRESWYAHSIESKTMIALFTLEDRADGKGSLNELHGINAAANSLKRLKKIDLYSKADLKKNGLTNAKPIKTVWFTYSYALCQGTPDNTPGGGKLTLERIYFTFNGKDRVNKNQYVFSYTNSAGGNPSYTFNAADRWGGYKLPAMNPGGMKNADYPYALQNKATADANAGAWALKKILLPSGGQIEVTYESDDYAYVQNRRAATMMEIAGLGSDAGAITNKLYQVNGGGIHENDYVFIKVPQPCTTKTEVAEKYLQGVEQLAFKVAVNMPKGVEYISSYATIADYGVHDATRIWIKLNRVDGLSPLSLTALEYLREQLPGQAFPGYDVSESSGLKQAGEMMLGMLDALRSAFKNPVNHLRTQGKAQTLVPERSFVRLNDPDGYKYGGGQRVKSVTLKDNWQAMTGQYTSEYGQEYNYETTEVFNGAERTISSGVASYEPSIGGEENPFQTIVQVANELPLGPTSYGAIEMPVLDAFFPAPVVGYSKVTVKALRKGTPDPAKKSRSGIGKQVTEFYTAKDFPVRYRHTALDPGSDQQEHKASLLAFFYKYAFDSRALSQGFLVETNDMHGKLKSQASYAEGDEKTRLNYSENFYRNTGAKGLGEKFDFVYAAKGGVVEEGSMGVDIELMTDTREFSVKSTSLEVQGQLDLFPVIVPVWLPFIWPVAGNSENTYRAVTTTKVVNYHSILDSVLVIDKGSMVSTKNLVYDAETGDVVVNRTANEFNLPVYSITYPAYWAYSGMGLAYKNMDAVYTGVNFRDGNIVSGNVPTTILESGDELYLMNAGNTPSDQCGSNLVSPDARLLWAYDIHKNTTSLTNTAPAFVFMDAKGKPYTKDNVSFRIIRSGKRNMLSASVAGITAMGNPVTTVGATRKLIVNNASQIINTSAVKYKEKWQTDNDLFTKYSLVFNPATCTATEQIDCNGYWEKSINPYRKGLLGNFRAYRNLIFYGDRAEKNPVAPTNLKQNGFLADYKQYWDFNTANNLVPDVTNPKWVWNSQITRVNAKGQELETKDALDVYTAAQYGYNKSMPVAIANNSRNTEMFYEGFEDNSYTETLNSVTQKPCSSKHIDFSTMPYSSIMNTDHLNFTAHTGKYVLGIPANVITGKSISLSNEPINDYTLQFVKDTTKTLMDEGLNIEGFGSTPQYMDPGIDLWGNHIRITPAYDTVVRSTYGYERFYQYTLTGSVYIQISQDGTYDLQSQVGRASAGYTNNVNMGFLIHSISGIRYPLSYLSNSYGVTNYRVCLTKGIYKIDFFCFGEDHLTCTNDPNTQCIPDAYNLPQDHFSFNFTNTSITEYKTLTTQNGCAFTKPLEANGEMLNPVFSIPTSKKMLFSAWVKEACGDEVTGVPCTQSTYTNNEVRLKFNDGSETSVVLTPSGTIIEGWQRYEGYFTAPADATNMALFFVNNTNSTLYFDDIRIHPFNANMKSYVYDPVSLRLTAELDANNYATFYEYDEEGTLIRTKAETKEGIKTIQETRSFKQRAITQIQ